MRAWEQTNTQGQTGRDISSHYPWPWVTGDLQKELVPFALELRALLVQASEKLGQEVWWELKELLAKSCSSATRRARRSQAVATVAPGFLHWPSECHGCHFTSALPIQGTFLLAKSQLEACWEENSGEHRTRCPGRETGIAVQLQSDLFHLSLLSCPSAPFPFTLSQISAEYWRCSRYYTGSKGKFCGIKQTWCLFSWLLQSNGWDTLSNHTHQCKISAMVCAMRKMVCGTLETA